MNAVIPRLLDSDPAIPWQGIRDRKAGDADWTRLTFPTRWHYDVRRGPDHLRAAGAAPDHRMAEAIDLVRAKPGRDGRWPLETRYPGRMPVEIGEGQGRPSRRNTLRALPYWIGTRYAVSTDTAGTDSRGFPRRSGSGTPSHGVFAAVLWKGAEPGFRDPRGEA